MAAYFYDDTESDVYMWDGYEFDNIIIVGLLHYATFFILLNTLIPISLMVSLEMVKFI